MWIHRDLDSKVRKIFSPVSNRRTIFSATMVIFNAILRARKANKASSDSFRRSSVNREIRTELSKDRRRYHEVRFMFMDNVHNVRTCVAMTYISVSARMRAVLATRRDTRAAITSVTCTAVRIRETLNLLSAMEMYFQRDAVLSKVEQFPESGPVLCGSEFKFPDLDALAQTPANHQIRPQVFLVASRVFR